MSRFVVRFMKDVLGDNGHETERIRATRWLAMTEIVAPSLRGAQRRRNPFFLSVAAWIASLRSQ